MIYFFAAAAVITAIAAVYDLRTGHIPNWLTLGALGSALVAHAAYGLASGGGAGLFEALLSACFGALMCALVPGIMFALGGMGGGDVKLFAAIGAACHVARGLEVEMYSFVIALLLAPAYLAWKGTLLQTLRNVLALASNPLRTKDSRRPVPAELMQWFRLAPAIFLGCAAAFVVHTARF
jgi:prepilin peptidase CpaA